MRTCSPHQAKSGPLDQNPQLPGSGYYKPCSVRRPKENPDYFRVVYGRNRTRTRSSPSTDFGEIKIGWSFCHRNSVKS